MPKLIPEIRETLMKEVRKLLASGDYSKITIRSVSSSTGIAVGTVYNYFNSKDMLVASVISEDWNKCLSSFRETMEDDAAARIEGIYGMLRCFIRENEKLFSNEDAKKKFSSISPKWHIMLREQIASLIRDVIKNDDFLPSFISESLLAWVMEDVEYEKLRKIIFRLIQEEK